ncbi:His-Xaa-Ser system protein HxsD [bacterium A37T11]|nr:His-Xaa-Ser system protein HxsD [bacterium A37T11]
MEIKTYPTSIDFYPQKSIYTQEVLFKCLYWYGGDYEVEVIDHDASCYCIRFQNLPSDTDQPTLISNLKRDLHDYKLRDIVQQETQNIRDLLVAKAFAFEDPDEIIPDTEISDPVGFDPLSVSL